MTSPTGPRLLVVGADTGAARAFVSLGEERGARAWRATWSAPGGDEEHEIERAFAAALQETPALDAVVCVLALDSPRTRVGDWSLREWESAVTAGLRVAFLAARRTVEELLAGGQGGRLAFLVCEHGSSLGAGHEATRAALRALVRSVAKEYGPKEIGCNAVVVGSADALQATRAAQVLWTLMAPEGAYVTGEVIDLADGR